MAQDKNRKTLNVPPLRFPGFTDEWKQYTIDEMANIYGRIGFRGYTTADLVEKGNGVISLSPSNIINNQLHTDKDNTYISFYKYEESPEIKIYEGDVIFVKTGSTVGKVAYVDKLDCKATLNPQLVVFKDIKCNKYLLGQILATSKIQKDISKITVGGAVPTLSQTELGKVRISLPEEQEQRKIASFLTLLDERIATQNKIIEDLKKLKSAIIDGHFNGLNVNSKIGDFIHEVSNRNKMNTDLSVLSVSNQQGFIAQSEQFENRVIASDDTSNYKIVIKDDFAYNPARINVGSIARLVNYESGIVSPMYICFRCSDEILPDYLELFFQSRYFQLEVEKRLEGSVRLCLSMNGIKSIHFRLLPICEQKALTEKLKAIQSKLDNEEMMSLLYQAQRKYLLTAMFI